MPLHAPGAAWLGRYDETRICAGGKTCCQPLEQRSGADRTGSSFVCGLPVGRWPFLSFFFISCGHAAGQSPWAMRANAV